MTIAIKQLFDQAVANGTEQEQLNYFARKLVGHPHLRTANSLAKDNIEFAPGGEIVAIIGPEAAGTSTLARSLKKYYSTHWATKSEAFAKDSMCHSIAIDAPSSTGRVDHSYWKRLLTGILVAGGDILYDKKIYVPPSEFQLCHPIPPAPQISRTNDLLLFATQRMLRHREANVLFINQAERLFPEGDAAGSSLTQQMLRDLATDIQTRIVLVSNYRILFGSGPRDDFMQGKQIVHLRRYDYSDAQEYEEYCSTLAELLGHVAGPLRLERITAAGTKRIYINPTGCIGALKSTLLLTVGHAHHNKEKITEELILQCGNTNKVAAKRAEDAKRGERMLTDVSESDVERILNGHQKSAEADSQEQQGTGAKAPRAGSKEVTAFRRRPIGERKPTRDPVGGVHAKRA